MHVFVVFVLALVCCAAESTDGSCDDARVALLEERIGVLEASRDYWNHVRAQKTCVTDVIQTGPGSPIAFTAYLNNNKNGLRIGDVVVFDKTLVNEGNAYDVNSGKFTAPSDGLYFFSFVIEIKHKKYTCVRLVVDNVNQLDAVVEPYHQEQNLMGSNMGVLNLKPGQKAWIQVYNSQDQSLEGLDSYRFTTFTGVLLHHS